MLEAGRTTAAPTTQRHRIVGRRTTTPALAPIGWGSNGFLALHIEGGGLGDQPLGLGGRLVFTAERDAARAAEHWASKVALAIRAVDIRLRRQRQAAACSTVAPGFSSRISCSMRFRLFINQPPVLPWLLPVLRTEGLLGREDLLANYNFAHMPSRLVHTWFKNPLLICLICLIL